MRRSTLVPFLLVAGLALFVWAWRAPSMSAQSRDCRKNCGEGEKPPACCTPPPCKLWEELKIAKAYTNFYAKSAGMNANNYITGMINIRNMRTCDDSGLGPPEPLEISTDGTCTIGVYKGRTFVPQSLDDALKNNKSCSELVNAEYAQAEKAAAFCQANLKRKKPLTRAQQAKQQQLAYQAKVDHLEDTIYSWLMACSKVVAEKLEEDQKDEDDLAARLKAMKDAKQKQLNDAAQKLMNWATRKLGFGK